MATTGTLAEVNLIDLIQVVCQERQPARLTIENDLGTASIFLDDGEIVHAASGQLEGRSALTRALSWEGGRFRLDKGIRAEARTIGGSTTTNLLAGLEALRPIAKKEASSPDVAALDREQASEHVGRVVRLSPAARAPAVKAGSDLVERLSSLPSVEQVVLVRKDGVALPQAAAGQDEDEGALAAFVGNAARAVGRALHLGELKRVGADLGGRSRVILPHAGGFAGLQLTDRHQRTSVATQAQKILGETS